MKKNKRFLFDILRYTSTSLATMISVVILLAIIIYVFMKGMPILSWDLIVSDNKSVLTTVSVEAKSTNEYEDPMLDDVYFSSRYGIGLVDSTDVSGEKTINIEYIADKSPFKNTTCIDNTDLKGDTIILAKGDNLSLLMGEDDEGNFVLANVKDGAKEYASLLDSTQTITSLQIKTKGGGIRGSLLTTLLLILVTLIIALPLGIGAAIYLVEYAKDGKVKNIISTMIDMTSGIPSIIFGFCGAVIFIPFVTAIGGKSGYTVLAGALTMTIVLLPTIIKTTSETLMVIPKHYTMASLALGASKTQTVFKVILPNAIPGILTAALLSIGRIIGESAALLFVMGSNISDSVDLLGQSTSLSLHIWSITSSDIPNYQTACAISIIILIIVFVVSVLVKLISKKINKMVVD